MTARPVSPISAIPSGAEEAHVRAAEEERLAQARVGDVVAMGMRDALDQAVQPQSPQLVRDPPHCERLRLQAEQGCEVGPQVGRREAAWQQPEDDQRSEEPASIRTRRWASSVPSSTTRAPTRSGTDGGPDLREVGGRRSDCDGVVSRGLTAAEAAGTEAAQATDRVRHPVDVATCTPHIGSSVRTPSRALHER